MIDGSTRDPWDDDDRVRCICIHLDRTEERERCLRSTRHPSQKCGDCREGGVMTTVLVERVTIPAWSTLGYGEGRLEDGTYVEVAGDWRPMRDIAEVISATDEPVAVDAPDYAIRTIPEPEETR